MATYEPTIGLEIHAELNTHTKMFCSSRNDPYTAKANTHICPVCLAHPGTLPVINREAVRHVLRVGVALGAKLADYTEFDRKNYFYPDLPKGYQLSQYEFPLVSGGSLKGVDITRVHLEEDTASSVHAEDTGATLIDYNRSGVPLMELVTEPVITSSTQAGEFARELQLLLRTLGASGANMERGEMRVEANVSVRDVTAPKGEFGTKVEIKNLNSFRAMERAVEYEIRRQIALLEAGERVVQETRGWDEGKQSTFSQRVKEGSADYRYFPDPDLPSLRISEIEEFARESLAASLPELPRERRERYIAAGIKAEDTDSYVRDTRFTEIVDQIIALAPETVTSASNYLANDVVKIIRDIEERDSKTLEKIPLSAANLVSLVRMIGEKKISSRSAKDILAAVFESDTDPQIYANEQGLIQSTDSSKLDSIVTTVIEQNPAVAADFRAGKAAALEFLLGQCMKQLRGAGDPVRLRELLKAKLVV